MVTLTHVVQENSNGAFGGNQYYRTENSTTYASNPSQSAPSTAVTWVNNGATFCSGVNRYQPQINSNPCHSPYGETQNLFVDNTSCLVPTSLQFSQYNYSQQSSCAGANTVDFWTNQFTLLDQYGSPMNAISDITINMDYISDHCYGYSNNPYTLTLTTGNSYVRDTLSGSQGREDCPYNPSECTSFTEQGFYSSNNSGLTYIP